MDTEKALHMNLISMETGEKYEMNLDFAISVGREETENPNDLVIDYKAVSRKHALIHRDREGIYLVDHGSRNGTTINAKPIAEGIKYYIKNGDIIGFADKNYLTEIQGNSKKQDGDDVINLGGVLARIEEASGRRRFIVDRDKSGIYHFEKIVLTLGECSSILPMHNVSIDGKDLLYYDFTGYVQLSSYINRIKEAGISTNKISNDSELPIEDALTVFKNILSKLKGVEEYLLSVNRVPLLAETIFINLYNQDIALTYLPAICDSVPLQQRIISLMDSLGMLYQKNEIILCFNSIKETILEKNLGIDGIVNTIGLTQREISYSLWTKKGLKRDADDTFDEKAPEPITEDFKKIRKMVPSNKNTRLIVSQIIILLVLAGIYCFKLFVGMDFIGFILLVMGIDFWILKSLKIKKS